MEQNNEQDIVTFFDTASLMTEALYAWVAENVKMSVISSVGELPGMAFVDDECLSFMKIVHPEAVIGSIELKWVKKSLANPIFNEGATLSDIYKCAKELRDAENKA